MKIVLGYLGWLAALALALTTFLLYQRMLLIDAALNTANIEISILKKSAVAAPAAPAPEAEAGSSPSQAFTPNAPETPKPDLGALLSLIKPRAPSEAQDRDAASNPMQALFAGEAGEAIAKQTAQTQVRMQYGELLRELSLDEERKKQVREILTEHLAEQMRLGMEFMQGGFKGEAPDPEASEAALREKLAAVLTPEELASFDSYQETIPQRMMAQSYDMQIQMFAGDMPEEARATLRDVMVEEMLATPQFGMPGQNPAQFSVDDAMTGQLAALDRAEERLRESLSPEDFEAASDFIATQRSIFENSGSILQGFMPQAEE